MKDCSTGGEEQKEGFGETLRGTEWGEEVVEPIVVLEDFRWPGPIPGGDRHLIHLLHLRSTSPQEIPGSLTG
jgi:hypothetical protein